MLGHTRSVLRAGTVLAIALTLACSAYAGDKGNVKYAPAVPGFTRFHQAEPANVEAGQLLYSTLNCASCHGAPSEVKSAPILDGVGLRIKRSYLKQFLSDPHAAKPGTTMPNLFADDPDKAAKVEALVHFLASTGTPTQTRPDGKGISSGQDLYHKVGCVACHGTRDSKGDQLAPGDSPGAKYGVPLGNLKAKYTLASLKTFLENPHKVRPSGRMPGIVIGKEASDVANYLMQGTVAGALGVNMNYAYYEGAWTNLPDFDKIKPIKSGVASDFDLGVARRIEDCAIKFDGFLKIENEGSYKFYTSSDDGSKLWIDGKLIVNNDGVHAPQTRSGKIKLTKGMHKLIVGVFNAGAGFELSVEIEGPGLGRQALGQHVFLAEKAEPPPPAKKDDEGLDLTLVVKGRELFASVGCANCHQMERGTKRLEAPVLAKLKAEGGCLQGTPKKGIPWFGLSAAQQTALRTLVRNKDADVKPSPQAIVEFTMKQFNCYACHERGKIGGVEEAVNPHFTSTFKEWGDETRIPPSLTGVGAKLKPAYFKKILAEGSHDRSYMNTRMPKFGASVVFLVDLLGSIDVAKKSPMIAIDEPAAKLKAAGRRIVGVGNPKSPGFGCVNCHNFGGVKTAGVQGIDMTIMTARLKREWFHDYLIDPNKYRPGTRMPSSFDGGKSQIKSEFNGSADAQIDAIWTYLADGKLATLPLGLNKQSIPLVPINEAIIYRNFIQGAGPRAIGVGFPEHAHLAFDANDMRLAMIWQGLFIDARRHWTDRGVGFEPPMGDNILHLPAGVSFFVLAKPDEAWPTKSAKDLGYKFLGYRLTDDQRPTFLYRFGDIKIEDTPNAVETKASPMIRRAFTLTTDNPIDKLYYRAAVADKIEAEKDGWFRVGDWRMRIESEGTPVIRQAGNKKELLVPIRFKGNSAKLVQEYVW